MLDLNKVMSTYVAPKTCSSTHIKIWQIDETMESIFFHNLYQAKNIVKTRKLFQSLKNDWCLKEKYILRSLLYHPWRNSSGAISKTSKFSNRNSSQISWRISMPLVFPSGKVTYLPLGAVHKLRLQEEGGRWSKNWLFVNFYTIENVNGGG